MGRWVWGLLLGAVALGPTGAEAVAAERPDADAALEGAFEMEVPSGEAGKPPILTLRGRIRITPDRPWPPVSSQGCVLHLVVVPWAQVALDDREAGRVSSIQLDVEPGAHAIRLEHPGYQPVRRRLVFLPGQTQRLVVDLAEEGIARRE